MGTYSGQPPQIDHVIPTVGGLSFEAEGEEGHLILDHERGVGNLVVDVAYGESNIYP